MSELDFHEKFWEQMAQRANPSEYEVGTVVTLEVTHGDEVLARKMIRITEVIEDAKGRHVQFDYLKPGEDYEDSGLIVVVPQ